jgi:hypothetical protein
LRGALIIETCALAELVVGPSDSRRTRFTEPTLNELTVAQALADEPDILGCIQGDQLETFRTWAFFVRDKATAHLDVHLPLPQILELLDEAVPEVTLSFADAMLDVLDLAACQLIPLRLLVLGQRRISSLAQPSARACPRATLPPPHERYLTTPISATPRAGSHPTRRRERRGSLRAAGDTDVNAGISRPAAKFTRKAKRRLNPATRRAGRGRSTRPVRAPQPYRSRARAVRRATRICPAVARRAGSGPGFATAVTRAIGRLTLANNPTIHPGLAGA